MPRSASTLAPSTTRRGTARRRAGVRRTASLGAVTLAAALTLAICPATAAFAATPASTSAATSAAAAAPSYASTLVAPKIRATQPPALVAFDQALLLGVNRARAAYHLAPLAPLAGLVGVANVWATHLAAPATAFGHNPSLTPMIEKAMPTVRLLGENIATFSVGSLSAHALLKAYLASPRHRANIMNPHYRYVGIVTRDGGDGMSYNTMNFAG